MSDEISTDDFVYAINQSRVEIPLGIRGVVLDYSSEIADRLQTLQDDLKEYTPKCECCGFTAYPLVNVEGDRVCNGCLLDEYRTAHSKLTTEVARLRKNQCVIDSPCTCSERGCYCCIAQEALNPRSRP